MRVRRHDRFSRPSVLPSLVNGRRKDSADLGSAIAKRRNSKRRLSKAFHDGNECVDTNLMDSKHNKNLFSVIHAQC